MAKIEVTKTELVWPGKYNDDGTRRAAPRVSLPFQVIETVNESRASREAKKAPQMTLFDIYQGKEGETFEDGWRNKLIWGDNLLVMGSLLEKFAGKIDLIYIDPPFATGADFSFTAEVGDSGIEVEKEQSAIEEKAYRDTWGRGLSSFLQMLYERLLVIRELLSERGSLYVHIEPDTGNYLRPILDELFGAGCLRTEIAWKRTSSHGNVSRNFGEIWESIFYYTRSPDEWVWNQQHVSFDAKYIESHFTGRDPDGRRWTTSDLVNPGYRPNLCYEYKSYKPHRNGWKISKEKMAELDRQGRLYFPTDPSGRIRLKRYLDETPGQIAQNLWLDVSPVNSQAQEALGYATQKPESLLERIIKTSSEEPSLVADFFCGSGTTIAVAEKLGRRWIGCDLSRWAIHVTRKRLLGIEGCKPFEVLNLGKYERQYWQGITFGERRRDEQQLAIFQYIAFILKLYGAEPLAGMQHLHGKKGKALVHVGAIDAPVTIDEINACLTECVALRQTELHILGWEWEMGLATLMVEDAKRRGVKLMLLTIPREVMEQQAVDKGDILFFELAYLEVEIKTGRDPRLKTSTAAVILKDFVIPNTDLIPEEVREKARKWSDYIDYWAVDWNFQNDTFMNGWVAYRTRKDRTLPLQSDRYTYDKPGTYTIMVKVIDIFGNDTSQTFVVQVQ
jgi:adenine-specific DNA-methyltransferase